MFKKHLISALKFTFFWLIFNVCVGSLSHISEAPMSVHQGAQCDRASIALNYYQNGMNFLYPEVHENRCKDGIVSCELPLSNYTAAMLYKIFGFHEHWFRLVTFIFVSLGMYALFLLFCLYLKPLTSYVLIFFINSSPILMFYAVNFLPDATALGLVLAAWYLFFRHFIPHPYIPAPEKKRQLYLFAFLLGLAIAVKTTCIIQWAVMGSALFLSYFKFTKIAFNKQKEALFSLLAALIIPLLWQSWARHLGQLHNSEYFMMHIPLPESYEVTKEAWSVYLGNWPAETYRSPFYIIVTVLLVLPLFLKKWMTNSLWYMTLFNTLFSSLFMALMIKQFMYHDYYVLCLLPALFINWIALSTVVTTLNSDYWWLKSGVFFLLLISLYYQFRYGKEHLEMRYTNGNYWEQSQQNTRDYEQFKTMIHGLGVSRDNCVLVGFDGAPNNVLYFLDLNGRRINSDFSNEQIRDAVNGITPTYVISNDTLFDKRISPLFKGLNKVAEYKYLKLYKVER